MPYWKTRSDLASAQFPFTSSWMGRSIILPTFDQNLDSTVSLTDAYKDKGKPQVFYMHNVIPTVQGFQSVGYDLRLAPATNLPNPNFDDGFLLRNSITDRFMYSPGVHGGSDLDNNIYDPYINEWRRYNLATGVANPLVTTAYVNNQTYIFIQGLGCYQYDKTVPGLVAVPLAGLVIANILGITAANGYMIAFTATQVFWSSLTDPTDFQPSLITGAGFGNVNDIKGPIALCLQISGGFVVYTERNAVGATFTANTQFPFSFKEITNSGGLQSDQDVISDTSNSEHYAITTSGLQKIDRVTAAGVFPEITDFLTAKVFEDFDEVARLFSVQYLQSQLLHKLSLCANRYLVISYGVTQLTHAIVYDIVMKRYGKFKITHVDCFDFFPPEKAAVPIPYEVKGSVGFLLADGSVKTVDFSSDLAASDGVFIIGKFQFVRSDVVQLNGFTWEAANPNGNFSAFVLTSLDGTNFQPAITPYLFASVGRMRDYLCMTVGVNVSLGVIGSFNLVSSEIEFMKAGSR